MTPKWKPLAKEIGINEDLVDEIFTNKKSDGECLKTVLKEWVKKSPTWRTVTDSLWKIGENKLAGSLHLKSKQITFTLLINVVIKALWLV